MRTTFLTLAALVLLTAGQSSSSAGGKFKAAAGKADAPYVHAVVFYLKKDAPKNADEQIIADCHKLLAKIPSVRRLSAGRPAAEATPNVAVTDYQVGLLVLFDDFAGLKTYLDHPLHTQFLERNGAHIQRVHVYDFLNQAK
jgi:hypothetical protein